MSDGQRPPHAASSCAAEGANGQPAAAPRDEVTLDCGWGRLLFARTYADHDRLLAALREERPGHRDIAVDPPDPHVLVARAPDELFLDPSLTFRLPLDRLREAGSPPRSVVVRDLGSAADAEAVHRLYTVNQMVPADPGLMRASQGTPTFTYLVAEDADTGAVIGTVTGIDHVHAWADPEGGTSLWCLAVDPQSTRPGVGEALLRALAGHFAAQGRAHLDLSVMHDNEPAIALYEKLGFVRVPVFCVKRKNAINEPLFVRAPPDEDLNPYAGIVAEAARRRGIAVRVLDAEAGYLELTHAGRRVVTRESLSELTTAVAMSRCDDKRVTRRILAGAGLRVPRGRDADFGDGDLAFLEAEGELVVKPARGEQGAGITVGVTTADRLRAATGFAREHCPQVLLERCHDGLDLRVLVIDHEVVAAAVRQPATVVGDGRHTVTELIEKQSRRRAVATAGEATIPMDEATELTVEARGSALDEVLDQDEELQVRRTANLHTGGTLHDVTTDLHPGIAAAAITASRALDIPVVGLDFIVPHVDGDDYVLIEANERPGLANHEPQPTAERFLDLLFPRTRGRG